MNARPSFHYTLLAYRPNGVDTCRNCVMGRSDSDFEVFSAKSAEQLADQWAKHRMSRPSGYEYCSTEYTLLVDGLSDDHDDWDDVDAYDPEENEPWTYSERKRVTALADQRYAELVAQQKAEKERQAAEAEARRLAAQAAEAAAKAARAEERDRAEFERLSKKFSGKEA